MIEAKTPGFWEKLKKGAIDATQEFREMYTEEFPKYACVAQDYGPGIGVASGETVVPQERIFLQLNLDAHEIQMREEARAHQYEPLTTKRTTNIAITITDDDMPVLNCDGVLYTEPSQFVEALYAKILA